MFALRIIVLLLALLNLIFGCMALVRFILSGGDLYYFFIQ